MAVNTYDPKLVILTVGGAPISGYADGTFISVERAADTFTKVVGADGNVSRAKSNDRSGTVKITLKQTSPFNDILSGIASLDEMSNAGVVPISIIDLSGSTIMFMPSAWVKKPPTVEFGKEIGNREWVFDFDKCEFPTMVIGGNLPVGL